MSETNGTNLNFQPYNPDQSTASASGIEIIFEEENPYGSLVASLENDGRTIYLYLNPTVDPSFQPRAVWIRNLVPAPEDTDREAMRQGVAPRIKKTVCKHPDGLPPITPEEVEFVWFQEGNGVALLLNGELEALLPPWSGSEGIFGYSKQSLGKDVGTIPFPVDSKVLEDRIQESQEFWKSRDNGKYWDAYKDRMLAHYEEVFGKHTNYFAVQSLKPPIAAVVEFQLGENDYVYATIGMSSQNMPGVESVMKDPQNHLRIELMTRRGDRPEWLPGIMGNLALHPWRSNNFFSHGHSYETGYASYEKSNILLTSKYSDRMIPAPGAMEVDGFPVSFLFAIPLDNEQMKELKEKGNRDYLEQLLKENGAE